MKNLSILFCLFIFPFSAYAGGDFFDAEVLEFTGAEKEVYILRVIQKSQPFGNRHIKDQEIVLRLKFICPFPVCLGEYNRPTREDFIDGINLLRSQIAKSKVIRIGLMGRGIVKIHGTENEYQSRGLKIYDGIVYSYYDF